MSTAFHSCVGLQTGNLHIGIYDLTANVLALSFMRNSTAPSSEPHYAYERAFTAFNMNDLFNEKAPSA